MKKNITNLIAQIGRNTSATRKESFKVTSVNANQYVNKILVEAEDFNEPTLTENYVREEMKTYQMKQQNQDVKNLEANMKRKAERPKDIEHQLNLLEKNYNLLALQEVMASMRSATKQEMTRVRNKLVKLENSLSFTLQKEDLEPHVQEFLTQFLLELTHIINCTNKIY